MRPLLSLVCAPPAAFLLLLTFAHGTEPRTLTRWVERRLPEGAHVVERTSFGRVTLSCAAAEFVARIDEPEAVSVRRADLRFERDHQEAWFGTTLSWGKECLEDEAVRQRYLTAIRDTHEWFWVSDFQHLVIVWNEVTERPYAVQTGG